MGSQMEAYKDSNGHDHLIFDKSGLYDDSLMGDKLSDFEVLRVLGSFNGQNIISKVRSLRNNKLYAMKKIELDKISNQQEKQLCIDQMEKLKTINHPHLLKYYKTFKDDKNNLYMIYEYMNNSDLNSFISAHQFLEKNIKEEEIWNILLQCLSGLASLHKENLAYLAIKPTNIFLNNEQNAKIGLLYDTPKLADKNYNIKNDIYFIGLYFYKMCYSQYDFIKDSFWIEDFSVQNSSNHFYSKELLNIIFSMIDEDPSKRKTASELYDIVKREYVKKYSNNTSINSVLRCLYSYSDLTKHFFKRENNIMANKEKNPITFWYLKTVKALTQNSNINECLEEFRRALASENSKLDGSKEVDPVFLLAFLLEKMHKETVKNKTEVKIKDLNEQYVINSSYQVEEEEDKTNKELMLRKFTQFFSEKMISIISDLFFGTLKTKRNCCVCRNGIYSFSNCCCIPFDLVNFMNYNKPTFNIIQDGFHKTHFEDKIINYFCDRCLTEQKHYEFNRIFATSIYLTICFYRGKQYQSPIIVDFPEVLNLQQYIEHPESPNVFHLVATINRYINNGKEEFIYFAKDPNNQNVWKSSFGDGPANGAPLNIIHNYGQVVMLFYSSKY